LEPGVYEIPLALAASLEPLRGDFERTLRDAQRRLRSFAESHGWAHLVRESFADRAEIFDSKAHFDDAVVDLCGLDPGTTLPPTACAALERRVLVSVSPQLYEQIYPQGKEDRAFEKLLAHEMAHRLHIRILGGDEDAMGPVWFFEGFAIHAAGQFEDTAPDLTRKEIREIVQATARGSYKRYAGVIRHVLRYVDLSELVARAKGEVSLTWLRETGII
jgi:hypothetical protein